MQSLIGILFCLLVIWHWYNEDNAVLVFIVAIAILYGIYGLWFDDLLVPNRHSVKGEMHLSGQAALTMFGAIIAGCLATILYYYDEKYNSPLSWLFSKCFIGVGVLLFFLAVFFHYST